MTRNDQWFFKIRNSYQVFAPNLNCPKIIDEIHKFIDEKIVIRFILVRFELIIPLSLCDSKITLPWSLRCTGSALHWE